MHYVPWSKISFIDSHYSGDSNDPSNRTLDLKLLKSENLASPQSRIVSSVALTDIVPSVAWTDSVPSVASTDIVPSVASTDCGQYTWASAASKAPPLPSAIVSLPPAATTIVVAKAAAKPSISRNRLGQRIDPSIKHNKEMHDRVKRLKLCNVHYLSNDCPYGSACCHVHNYKPNAQELSTLRLVARMAPCKRGSECDDAKCIFGHGCPIPDGRNGSCSFGAQCHFPKELHNLDKRIVHRSGRL